MTEPTDPDRVTPTPVTRVNHIDRNRQRLRDLVDLLDPEYFDAALMLLEILVECPHDARAWIALAKWTGKQAGIEVINGAKKSEGKCTS